MNSPDEDLLDNDPTDELPILVETAVLDPAMVTAAVAPGAFGSAEESTGEHTIHYPILPDDEEERPRVDAMKADLQARAARIEALELDVRRLSGRWLDVEQRLTEKEALVEELRRTLATSEQTLDEQTAAAQRLAAQVADRDSELQRLHEELDEHRQQDAARALEIEQERRRAKDIESELGATRAQLAEQLAKPPAPPPDERVHMLQEEIASLTGYIANRRSRWDELEATTASALARIAELERELAHRTARQRSAEELAQRETARAESFRRDLVEMSRAVQSRSEDVATLRAAHAGPQADVERLRTQLDEAAKLNLRLQGELDGAAEREASAERRAADERRVAAELKSAAASAPILQPPASPTIEVLAQVEAELEHKRAQLTGQAEELHAKSSALDAAVSELHQLRRQLAETRAQTEQNRADVGRLERALIDKDRSLDARNERIATLQQELEQKLGALQKLNAMDLSLQGLDAKMSERLKQADQAEQTKNTPALVCLTSDTPRRYALTKATITIGRSSQCDIQIATHFVSREHARITVDRSRVMIEDLGSTNGVFVNAVRIDRQELHHSDLVTVGETQFRFLERMAH